MRSLRQILLVLLTAIAAITAGRVLRDLVDKASSPAPSPTIVAGPSASPS